MDRFAFCWCSVTFVDFPLIFVRFMWLSWHLWWVSEFSSKSRCTHCSSTEKSPNVPEMSLDQLYMMIKNFSYQIFDSRFCLGMAGRCVHTAAFSSVNLREQKCQLRCSSSPNNREGHCSIPWSPCFGDSVPKALRKFWGIWGWFSTILLLFFEHS